MKKLLNKIKKFKLSDLSFNTLLPFLVGLVILLAIIYIIFLRPQSTTTTTETPAQPQEEQAQFHQDLTPQLEANLPHFDNNYMIILQKGGTTDTFIIYQDKTDPTSLESAYLFLQQFGVLPGDSRIQIMDYTPGL